MQSTNNRSPTKDYSFLRRPRTYIPPSTTANPLPLPVTASNYNSVINTKILDLEKKVERLENYTSQLETDLETAMGEIKVLLMNNNELHCQLLNRTEDIMKLDKYCRSLVKDNKILYKSFINLKQYVDDKFDSLQKDSSSSSSSSDSSIELFEYPNNKTEEIERKEVIKSDNDILSQNSLTSSTSQSESIDNKELPRELTIPRNLPGQKPPARRRQIQTNQTGEPKPKKTHVDRYSHYIIPNNEEYIKTLLEGPDPAGELARYGRAIKSALKRKDDGKEQDKKLDAHQKVYAETNRDLAINAYEKLTGKKFPTR